MPGQVKIENYSWYENYVPEKLRPSILPPVAPTVTQLSLGGWTGSFFSDEDIMCQLSFQSQFVMWLTWQYWRDMQRSVLHLKLKNSSRAPRYSKIQDGTQQEQIVLERTAKSKLETTPSAFGKSIQFVDRIIHILMEGCTDLLNCTGLYWPLLVWSGLCWVSKEKRRRRWRRKKN